MFTAAEDGQKAVDAYKAAGGAFNLFLADVQMPIKVRDDFFDAVFFFRDISCADCILCACAGWRRSVSRDSGT